MSFQKRFINFLFSFGLGTGLLVAQICTVICLAANCTEEKQVVTPTPAQSTGHCHNSSSPSPQEPAPQHDSHNCQNHDLTMLLAASGSPLDATIHIDWQPLALLPARLEFVFSQQPMARIRIASLRSPPRIPLRPILRI